MSKSARILAPNAQKDSMTTAWHRWDMQPLSLADEEKERLSRTNRAPAGAASTVQPDAAPASAAPADDIPDPNEERAIEMRRQLFEIAKKEAEDRAWKAAYEAGYQAGFESGEQDARARSEAALDARVAGHVEHIEVMIHQFRQALHDYSQRQTQAVTELALETGRKLAGEALRVRPEQIIADVEAMLEEEGHTADVLRIYLHPDDYTLVHDHLQDTLKQTGWQLRSDHKLMRGDCRLETEQQTTLSIQAERWQRLLHAVQLQED